MLAIVTGGWRRKAGALIVALYALCLVAPVAAFAAAHDPESAHCLGQHQHVSSATSDHHRADSTQDVPADHDHGQTVKCCGLFGVTAIAPEFLVVAVDRTAGSDITIPHAVSLLDSRSGRIDRPPRDLLSL